MSREYAEKRIKDALKKTSGNATKARQQVIAWTYEDPKLLHALTKAHLSGIVAYNIERILSGRSAATETNSQANSASQSSSTQTQAKEEENFGQEILKAISANDGAVFGLEGYAGVSRTKSKVSQSHIDAINAMTKGRKE